MMKGLEGAGGAEYFKSRHKDGGHKMTHHHELKASSMNKQEAATVKKSEARQAAKQDEMVAKDPKERAIYAGAKSSKKPGGCK